MTVPARAGRRASDERGAAVLELALAFPLLLLILFGIISYGLLMSYKQGMTQVAAEAARAGAVAGSAAAVSGATAIFDDAAPRILDRTCGTDGLTCTASLAACDDGSGDCLSVEVHFDNGPKPLVPPIPLLSAALPGEMTSKSVVRVIGP